MVAGGKEVFLSAFTLHWAIPPASGTKTVLEERN